MENKIKKESIAYFVAGLLGYFIGSISYTLLVKDTGQNVTAFKLISGILVASVFYSLIKLYVDVKYNDFKKRKEEIFKDERNIVIRGKAAYLTLTLLLIALFISIIIVVIKQNLILSYFGSTLYVGIFLIYNISKIYWNKKI